MIHCDICHSEVAGMAKHLNFCIKKDVECKVCISPELKNLEKEIRDHGEINYAEGVFGDCNRNKAYFGSAIMTPKGMQYPIFGCSYLYPNTLLGPVHDACTTLKRVLMATTELFLKRWYFFNPLILIFYKKAFRVFIYWFAQIYEVELKQKTYKYLVEFAPVPREIIRAGLVLAKKIPLKNSKEEDVFNFFDEKEFEEIDDQEYRIRVKRCIWAIGTFIQSDSAYRIRPQDALCNLNKKWLQENPRKEILRLFDIVLQRENSIKHKIFHLKKLVSILLFFPPARKLIFEYFSELDVAQFVPDEADRYFAARNQGYNFEGKSVEEKRQWADEIDLAKNHVIIKT